MKNLIVILSLLLMVSCEGQKSNQNLNIDSSNVKEIIIMNKVYCSMHELNTTTLKIDDKDKIDKIVNAFSFSEIIPSSVNTKASNGFFEISFNDGVNDYYYGLIYTTYDGVILINNNNNNGDRYKNDRLEGVIYPLFVK